MTLDFFRSQGVIYPELCFRTSSAVGFSVSIYAMGGGTDQTYQVMKWNESPGLGQDFSSWYQFCRPQFFATPELAAAAFVSEWQA